MTDLSTSRNADRWRLINAWFTMYVVGADFFVISPLLPQITTTLRTNPDGAGWLVSAFSMTYAVTSPLLGYLGEKCGRRRMIFWGLLIFGSANLWTAIATTFPSALASRCLAGMAVSAISPSIYAAMGDRAPPGRRAHWISIAVSGLLTALWTSAPLGALLGHVMHWQSIFVLLAGSALLMTWPNLLLWPEPPRLHRQARDAVIGLPSVLRSVAPTVAWGTALYGLYTYLGVGLAAYPGISTAMTAACFVCWGVGAICGNHVGGWAADRCGADRTATFSLAAMAVAMVMLKMGLDYRIGAGIGVCAMLFMLSLVSYPYQPAQQSRLVQASSTTNTSLLAWNSSALYLGMTIGSALFGFAFEKWGFSSVSLAGAFVAVLGVLFKPRVGPAKCATARYRA